MNKIKSILLYQRVMILTEGMESQGKCLPPPTQTGPERFKQAIRADSSFANDPYHLLVGRFEKNNPVTGVVYQAGGRCSLEPGDDKHVAGSPADIEGCYQDDR